MWTSNIPEVAARLQQEPEKITRLVGRLMKKAVYVIDKGVHTKTPVWSGKAVRNMIWSKNRPNTREFPEIEVGSIDGEGRRGANEAAARRTLASLDFNKPFGVYYLSNVAEHIMELEAGQLPSPERSRVPPGGMFGLTYSEVKRNLRSLLYNS